MKMDAEYFKSKFDELLVEIQRWENNKSCGKFVNKILVQIAKDAAEEQIEAACREVDMETNASWTNWLIKYAIRESKMEFPHE